MKLQKGLPQNWGLQDVLSKRAASVRDWLSERNLGASRMILPIPADPKSQTLDPRRNCF